jgi:hypothetical protein
LGAYTKEEMENLYVKILLFSWLFSILLFGPLASKAFLEDFLNDLENIISDVESNVESNIETEGNSTIINKVNISTNTGGNTAESGEIIEGEQKSTIKVKNIINGTEIDPIDIETDASDVKFKSEINVDDNKATVDREIDIDGDKTEENYQVDIEEQETSELQAPEPDDSGQAAEEENITNNLGFVGQLWSNLVHNLKNIWQKVFNIF